MPGSATSIPASLTCCSRRSSRISAPRFTTASSGVTACSGAWHRGNKHQCNLRGLTPRRYRTQRKRLNPSYSTKPGETGRRRPTGRDRLFEYAAEIISLVQRELNSHRVSLRTDLAPAVPTVLGDRIQLQQVIINLLTNCIEAIQSVTDPPRGLVVR